MSRYAPPYSKAELNILHDGIERKASLSELEEILNESASEPLRSVSGIGLKLQRLSLQDPTQWDPEKVRPYLAEVHSRQWASVFTPKGIAKAKRMLQGFLAVNPDVTVRGIQLAGLRGALIIGYGGSLNSAKAEAGLPTPHGRKTMTLAARRERLLGYLKAHPDAHSRRGQLYRGFKFDLQETYGNIDAARIAAGIVPDLHISSANAARYLGLTRSGVSSLFYHHKLSGVKVADRVYVSILDVEKWRLGRQPVRQAYP